MTRYTRLTGTIPLSTPTVGRPDGTTNCLSVKLISQLISHLRTTMLTAIFTVTNSSPRSFQLLFHRFSLSHLNGPLHLFYGSSRATRLTPSNAVFDGTTRSVRHWITLSQRMSPTGHPSGVLSTNSIRTSYVTVSNQCAASCLPITSMVASSL